MSSTLTDRTKGTEVVSFRAPMGLRQTLKVKAAMEDTSLSAVITNMINVGLAAEKKKAADERQLADR